MRRRQDDAGLAELYRFLDIRPSRRPTPAVAPRVAHSVEPAAIGQGADGLTMRPAAPLADTSGALEAHTSADLRPVDRIEPAQLTIDRQSSPPFAMGHQFAGLSVDNRQPILSTSDDCGNDLQGTVSNLATYPLCYLVGRSMIITLRQELMFSRCLSLEIIIDAPDETARSRSSGSSFPASGSRTRHHAFTHDTSCRTVALRSSRISCCRSWDSAAANFGLLRTSRISS